MYKIRIKTSWLITIFFLLMFSFIYLVLNFYQTALTKSRATHQLLQLEMAKSAAAGMSNYLELLENDLWALSFMPIAEIQRSASHIINTENAICSIFLLDAQHSTVYEQGEPLPTWVNKEIDLAAVPDFQPAVNTKTEKLCWYSSIRPMEVNTRDSSLVFLMVVPYQYKTLKPGMTAPVYIGYVIRFNWLTNKFILPLKLSSNDFAWMLDGQGRLIYHPNHKEMLLRSIGEMNQDCQSCHTDFFTQQEMLLHTGGTGEYFIKGEPSKIMAYTSVQLEKQKWILAISTYKPWVIQDDIDTFLVVFILAGVFLLLLLAAGIIFYLVNLRRVRAEEAERRIVQAHSFQEKLNQAAKLASIGELVDSVAHEINTPTGIIATVTDTLLLKDCAKLNCAEDLDVVRDQVRRIKKYTKSLLGFSRRLPFQPKSDDIVELIDECIFLVSPRIRAQQIKIIRVGRSDLPKFVFDRVRIEQVIINLLNNAIDFVDPGGEISIGIEIKSADNGRNFTEWVCIAITDNGRGIAAEDLPFIFEPFFSTKPISKGTGLGLSISKTIMDRHEGKIVVDSQPDKGTSFSIYLPLLTG